MSKRNEEIDTNLIKRFPPYLLNLKPRDRINFEAILPKFLNNVKKYGIKIDSKSLSEDCRNILEKIHCNYLKIKDLGLAVKELRDIRKMSLTKLAELSGLSVSMMSRIESGTSSMPKMQNLITIARALSIDPQELFSILGYTQVDENANLKWESVVERITHELALSPAATDRIINFFKYEISQKNGGENQHV